MEDRLRRMGLNVGSAAMSIERPDAWLKERGVIPARGGTTSLLSEKTEEKWPRGEGRRVW